MHYKLKLNNSIQSIWFNKTLKTSNYHIAINRHFEKVLFELLRNLNITDFISLPYEYSPSISLIRLNKEEDLERFNMYLKLITGYGEK